MQTGVIERLDRVHDGEVAKYIAEAIDNGWSQQEIAAGLNHIFGLDVNRTTVARYLRRNPSTPGNGSR